MAETIDIDFGGESIKVPKWATEDTLRLLVQALDKPTKRANWSIGNEGITFLTFLSILERSSACT